MRIWVTVANAPDELKQVADLVVCDNDHHAIAKFDRYFIGIRSILGLCPVEIYPLVMQNYFWRFYYGLGDKKELMKTACKVRMGVIEAVFNAKSGHPGGSLNCRFAHLPLF